MKNLFLFSKRSLLNKSGLRFALLEAVYILGMQNGSMDWKIMEKRHAVA